MTLVPESVIDEIAEELNASEGSYEAIVEELRQRQPIVLSYLLSDDFEAFTSLEQEFLLYLALVIDQAVARVLGPRPTISEQQLSDAEERNWELLQPVTARGFHERLDVFFQDSPQEDLLAFVEDALSDDSDEIITKEGREAMFVALKAVIDCLTAV